MAKRERFPAPSWTNNMHSWHSVVDGLTSYLWYQTPRKMYGKCLRLTRGQRCPCPAADIAPGVLAADSRCLECDHRLNDHETDRGMISITQLFQYVSLSHMTCNLQNSCLLMTSWPRTFIQEMKLCAYLPICLKPTQLCTSVAPRVRENRVSHSHYTIICAHRRRRRFYSWASILNLPRKIFLHRLVRDVDGPSRETMLAIAM